MYELIQVANNTYYVNCPAKIGIYRCEDNGVYLIDSGNDKDAGRKVRRVLEAEEWHIKAILNTHSHADHTGGNRYFQQNTGCKIFAYLSNDHHATACHIFAAMIADALYHCDGTGITNAETFPGHTIDISLTGCGTI